MAGLEELGDFIVCNPAQDYDHLLRANFPQGAASSDEEEGDAGGAKPGGAAAAAPPARQSEAAGGLPKGARGL